MKNLKKFKEFKEFVGNNPQRAEKKIKEVQKMRQTPENMPFINAMHLICARAKNDIDEQILYSRRLVDNCRDKLINNYEIILEPITTFQRLIDIEDLSKIYESLQGEETSKQALALKLIIPDYKAAQSISMDIVRSNHTPENLGIAAVCASLLAKDQGQAMFHKFCLGFLDKLEQHSRWTAELKAETMIETGNAQGALDFLLRDDIKSLFVGNDLNLRRLIIRIYDKLGNNDELIKCAIQFLEEYNADSLDEWKIIVQHSPNANEIINKYKDGKRRGPLLAEIDYAIQKGEDPSSLLLQYSDLYKEKNNVFGDIKKYLSIPEVKEKLTGISDIASRVFCTSDISFLPTIDELKADNQKFNDAHQDENDKECEKTEKILCGCVNGRVAAIIGEYYIYQYLHSDLPIDQKLQILQKAFDAVLLFPEHQDCQFLYIKLLGLVNATANQRKAWDHLRLEAIQLYSIGAVICYDFIRCFNLVKLQMMVLESNNWYLQSVFSFQPSFVKTFEQSQLKQVESMANFVRQIRTHIMRKFYLCINSYITFLKKTVNKFNEEQLLYFENHHIFDQNDKTTLPLYIDDKLLEETLYPSLTDFTNALYYALQILYKIHYNEKDLIPALIEKLKQTNIKWNYLIQYIDSEYTTIPTSSDNVDIFQLSLIVLFSKTSNKYNEQKEQLTTLVNDALKHTAIQKDSISLSIDYEAENKDLKESIDLLLN